MHAVVMPKLGLTMTEGTIAGWLKQPGDEVVAGEEIAEIETDKITYSLEAPVDGTLFEILLPAGESAQVKETIAWIEQSREELSETRFVSNDGTNASNQPSGELSKSKSVEFARTDTVLATPLAKKTARENDVNLHQISGTGPNGRIQSDDVKDFLHELVQHPKAAPAATVIAEQTDVNASRLGADGERVRRVDIERSAEQTIIPHSRVIPHSPMRKAIANRMTESWKTIPHVTLHRTIPVTGMIDLQRKASDFYTKKVSLTAVIASLISRLLPKFPYLNAHYEKEGCRIYEDVHIGIAVSVQNGLIVPVIRNAHKKSIPELADEIEKLSERARTGSLEPNEIEGGTFTISSLGMYGIDGFTPIILPPQTGILGIGRIVRSTQSKEEVSQSVTRMTVSLSFDHRALDGVYGAQFLESIAKCFEDPLQTLL